MTAALLTVACAEQDGPFAPASPGAVSRPSTSVAAAASGFTEGRGARPETRTPTATFAAASFGTEEDCHVDGALCLPTGTLVLDYTTTGSTECTYNATIDWGDGSTDQITFSSATSITHQYTSPGVYTVQDVGSGSSSSPDITCTFHPLTLTVEVPQPQVPPLEPTGAALDLIASLSKTVGDDWARMAGTFWTHMQNAFKLFEFARNIEEFNSYPEYLLARADAAYAEDPAMRGNMDAFAMSFHGGQSYAALPQGQRLQVAQALQNELRATGWLLERARKAGKSGAELVFTLP